MLLSRTDDEESTLVEHLARAKFLMRVFTTAKLKNAVTLFNNIDSNWPASDYEYWHGLNTDERQKWISRAEAWLSDLKTLRPNQYQVLLSGWKNIDNG